MTMIATRYKCTVYDIKTWNNLKKNSVQTGQLLTIYVNKKVEVSKPESKPTASSTSNSIALAENNTNDEANATPEVVAEKTVEKKLAENAVKSKFYTVKKGDTLFRIASENNLSLDELLRLNDMNRNSTLKIGQRLEVR